MYTHMVTVLYRQTKEEVDGPHQRRLYSRVEVKMKVKRNSCTAPCIVYKPFTALRHGSHRLTCKGHHACFYLVSVYQMALPIEVANIYLQLTTHLSTPKEWKAGLTWSADLQRTVYPHKWSPISWRSRVRQGKFTGQDRRSCHCATPPTYKVNFLKWESKPLAKNMTLQGASQPAKNKTSWRNTVQKTVCWSAWLSGRTSVSGQHFFAVL